MKSKDLFFKNSMSPSILQIYFKSLTLAVAIIIM